MLLSFLSGKGMHTKRIKTDPLGRHCPPNTQLDVGWMEPLMGASRYNRRMLVCFFVFIS